MKHQLVHLVYKMRINSAAEEHCGTDVKYIWEGQDAITAQACTGGLSLKAISLFDRERCYHSSDASRKTWLIIITLFCRSWIIL